MGDRAAREKLVHQGVTALDDAELLSIVIRDGSSGQQAVELAGALLNECGGLGKLASAEFKALRMARGLGVVKAAALAATFELARRIALSGHPGTPKEIRTNEDVAAIFRPQIAMLPYEEFWVLYLSSANTVVGKEKAAQGGVAGVMVDHRLVVKRAVELLASGMVLVHNHPSGVAVPSGDDHDITSRIADAARLFDIQVIDHLIITPRECFSFRQAGLVK